jgi:hypothetical protein
MHVLFIHGALDHTASDHETTPGREERADDEDIRWVFVSIRVKKYESVCRAILSRFNHRGAQAIHLLTDYANPALFQILCGPVG